MEKKKSKSKYYRFPHCSENPAGQAEINQLASILNLVQSALGCLTGILLAIVQSAALKRMMGGTL